MALCVTDEQIAQSLVNRHLYVSNRHPVVYRTIITPKEVSAAVINPVLVFPKVCGWQALRHPPFFPFRARSKYHPRQKNVD
jgi:hypothetical protein